MSPIPPALTTTTALSPKPVTYPTPKLRIHLNELSHEATHVFLSSHDPTKVLADAMATVLRLLYDLEQTTSTLENNTDIAKEQPPSQPFLTGSAAASAPTVIRDVSAKPPSPNTTSRPELTSTIPIHHTNPYPPVRSITLILSDCGGVANTSGLDLDDAHKEIHFNLGHIMSQKPEIRKKEILGVLVHEMVHCWQCFRNTPIGLIEGIADWVRLNAGLAPPHWRRRTGDVWDAGYEATGYFLDWLERHKCGKGTVRNLNAWLRRNNYDHMAIWKEVCGGKVEELWDEYNEWVEKHPAHGDKTAAFE